MKLILDTEKRTISEIPQESDETISKHTLEADIGNILAMTAAVQAAKFYRTLPVQEEYIHCIAETAESDLPLREC